MKIIIEKVGAERICQIIPKNSDEARQMEDLSVPDQPMTAFVRENRNYLGPHIEIRKPIL